jgi:enamine deaminase RidA (YjgF/YER057c/UK114 family)
MEILLPSGWPRPSGYSNGIAAQGRLLFVAGQIAWDDDGQIVSEDLAAQVGQALKNVLAVLQTGKAEGHDIVRMTWYLTDKEEYLKKRARIGEIYRAIIGKHYPAMSLLFVQDLLEPGAKVEIEVTAVIPDP